MTKEKYSQIAEITTPPPQTPWNKDTNNLSYVYFPNLKTVYCITYRTASTFIKRWLYKCENNLEETDVTTATVPIHQLKWNRLTPLQVLDKKDCLRFAVIRHPIDKMLSMFYCSVYNRPYDFRWWKRYLPNRKNNHVSFDEFMEVIAERTVDWENADIHCFNQSSLLTHDDKYLPTHIGLYSDIEKFLANIAKIKNILPPDFNKKINTSAYCLYTKEKRSEVSKYAKKMIEKRYEKDYELYDKVKKSGGMLLCQKT